MNLLTLIKKHYLKITVVLILVGLFIDLFFTDAIPQKTSQTITDLTGKSISFDAYFFSYKYEILKIVSNICYSLAISILVLLAVEIKYDEVEKEKFRILEENERKDFKSEIKELQDQINNNVFEGVLKRLIPEELFNLIAKDILNKNIIRQNAHWIYEVSENDQQGYSVVQTISYELKNISRNVVTENLTVTLTTTKIVESYFNFFKVLKDDKIVIEKKRDQIKTELEASGSTTQNSSVKKYPIEIQPNETIHITLCIVNNYKTKIILDSHSSNYSIVGLTIQVNKPENCTFHIHPTFTSKLKPTVPNEKQIIYEKIPGLLIGQGLTYVIEEN